MLGLGLFDPSSRCQWSCSSWRNGSDRKVGPDCDDFRLVFTELVVPKRQVVACRWIERKFAEMAQGTIKKLTQKGFGFIDTGRGDLFFHAKALQGTTFDDLYEGQEVEFTEGRGPKGPNAENVRPIG